MLKNEARAPSLSLYVQYQISKTKELFLSLQSGIDMGVSDPHDGLTTRAKVPGHGSY